ncbi:rhamnogalacturonan lyase family protein [Cellulosimicrobium sp. Marseille-Q8652]
MTHPRRTVPLLMAAVLATGVGVTVAQPASAAAGCRVDYTVTHQWGGGFGADVTITNLGDTVDGWTLTWSFDAGQTVTQAWNAAATQGGAQVSARNVSHNAGIATGASTSFGFNGTWAGSNPVPTAFVLNGTRCTGSPVDPTTPPVDPTPPDPVDPTPPVTAPAGSWQAEDLDRGLISVRSGSDNLVQWRLLGTEAASTGFTVYRDGTRVAGPITGSTNYLDPGAPAGARYTVRAVVNGSEQAASPTSLTFGNGYLDVPIQRPSAQHVANDGSVGDLDGDGRLEIVLKWDPTDAKDNSQSGVTGNVFVDAYQLDGTRMWRIDLGRNIRAGAHYTQFQVYDYDGDGKAEVAMKTADGTRSGTGQVIGDANADHRNSGGYVLSGPEYLTVFTGQTGAIGATTDYVPARGTVSSWGDGYGNRVDRFLAGTAYLDGSRPSIIMARGYYTRAVVVAWDYRDGRLTRRWTFDSNVSGNSTYAGQGNHSLSVADVDQDGRQEILYGSAAIDDDGRGLWNTRNGHGDAGHVGDLIPSRPGLEYYKVDEDGSKPASWMADARTGQVLWSTPPAGDNGRGVSADVWPGSPGAESWSSADSQMRNTSGQTIGRKPGSANFLAYWDGDTSRELLDGTQISKYGTGGDTRLLTGSGVRSNNGTKSTPVLSGDLLGDWREEVVWAKTDDTGLRIHATPTVTSTRVWTLLHDQTYRVAIAWQNTAYNQPPHTGFFLGTPFTLPAQPRIYTR